MSRTEIEDWGADFPINLALAIQDRYWAEKVYKSETPDRVIFVEHEPVYTAGASLADNLAGIKKCFKKNLFDLNCPLIVTGRGGLVTYQGPGILSVYLIMDIRELLPKTFNDFLLSSAEAFLKNRGIKAARNTKNPGLYIGENKKIVSLGTKISKNVSRFGITLSLNPEEKYIEPLIPCGIENMRLASLAQELGRGAFSEKEKNEIKKDLAAEIISKI